MESLRNALAGIFLLLSLATGQYTPKAVPACQNPLADGGSDYLPHETYCQMYYRCVADQKYSFTCGGDLLFNSESNTCDYPRSAMCANWPCTAANNNTYYPHVCGDQYFTCVNNAFVKNTCAAGQRFDSPTGACMAGTVVDQPACSRAVRNETATCYHKADQYGDQCRFQTVDGNITHMERSCPDKMAFNETSCGCTTPNDACPKPDTKTANKMPDNMCRASMVLSFDLVSGGILRAFSNKISANLNDSFQTTGVTYNNGIATLSSPGNTPAQIYWYYANSNELTRNTGFVITFRFAAATSTPVYLLTNNFNGACVATFNVTATLTGTTYSVTASATFMTRHSMTNITYTMDTVTASLSVAAANSFLEVIVIHDTIMRLKLTDKGAAGSTTGQVATKEGTANLGPSATYTPNKCGLAIGYGFNGDIAEVAVHEGCRNVTMLLNR